MKSTSTKAGCAVMPACAAKRGYEKDEFKDPQYMCVVKYATVVPVAGVARRRKCCVQAMLRGRKVHGNMVLYGRRRNVWGRHGRCALAGKCKKGGGKWRGGVQ